MQPLNSYHFTCNIQYFYFFLTSVYIFLLDASCLLRQTQLLQLSRKSCNVHWISGCASLALVWWMFNLMEKILWTCFVRLTFLRWLSIYVVCHLFIWLCTISTRTNDVHTALTAPKLASVITHWDDGCIFMRCKVWLGVMKRAFICVGRHVGLLHIKPDDGSLIS